jgi:hypothetical protein
MKALSYFRWRQSSGEPNLTRDHISLSQLLLDDHKPGFRFRRKWANVLKVSFKGRVGDTGEGKRNLERV